MPEVIAEIWDTCECGCPATEHADLCGPCRHCPHLALLGFITAVPVCRRFRFADGGTASVELALMAPVLIALLLFVVALGRVAGVRSEVEEAARDAARAAVIARSPATATVAGRVAAAATLNDAGTECRSFSAELDVAGWGPGAMVTATVACVLDLGDLALLRIPATRTVTARATDVVDYWRSTDG